MGKLSFILAIILCFWATSVHSQVLKGKKVSIQLNNSTLSDNMSEPDNQGPALSIISPLFQNGVYYESPDKELVLVGRVWDESGTNVFSINSEMVDFNDEGGFVYTIDLKPGQNSLRLLAGDKKNNITDKTVFIFHSPPEPTLAEMINDMSIYYALVIGIDIYEDYRLPDLDNPIKDCGSFIEAITKNYTFEEENITFLRNATRADMISSLDELTRKVTPNDNLLIFYAGHGLWDEKSNNGYWLPSDAVKDVKTNWVRNSAVVDYLAEIDSKHTLLITDACFGGAIFETRSGFTDDEEAFEQLYELPSRTAMTSGNKTEVPDRSSFAKYLIQRLNSNQEKYLTSSKLFNSFQIAVIKNSKAIPQYGDIENTGDQGGDFIFLKRD